MSEAPLYQDDEYTGEGLQQWSVYFAMAIFLPETRNRSPETPSPQALNNEWPVCSVGDRVRLVREADNKVNLNPDTQNWI
jgi:hypothetical protein